jgi:adenylate kinase family enzyme
MSEVEVRRIALTGASGNGKTMLARAIARSRSLPFLDLEGTSRARATELIAADQWVTDATHERALGDLVVLRAQMLVWLDLPLPLLLWRAVRRGGRIAIATVGAHFSNRRSVPARVGRYPHVRLVRLRSPREVRMFATESAVCW